LPDLTLCWWCLMKGIESPGHGDKSNLVAAAPAVRTRQHRPATYQKVRDERKHPIRGLWVRNGGYYAQVTLEDPHTAAKSVRRVPLRRPPPAQAKAALEEMLVHRFQPAGLAFFPHRPANRDLLPEQGSGSRQRTPAATHPQRCQQPVQGSSAGHQQLLPHDAGQPPPARIVGRRSQIRQQPGSYVTGRPVIIRGPGTTAGARRPESPTSDDSPATPALDPATSVCAPSG